MTGILLHVKRHTIIHLSFCQTHMKSAVELPVDKYIYGRIIVTLLNRHQQKLPAAVHAHKGIVYSKMVHSNSVGTIGVRCHHKRSSCHKSGKSGFYFIHIDFILM